jgi:uncharacterized protein (TIGR02996 family)
VHHPAQRVGCKKKHYGRKKAKGEMKKEPSPAVSPRGVLVCFFLLLLLFSFLLLPFSFSMHDTLAALHAAITDAPTDRTVRLVYADALDESGDPLHAARAEFIRGQVRLEGMADEDPERAALVARCDELFAEHWIDWWRPVCAAVGLPEPFVPKRRLRDRVKRLVRSERPVGAPYTCSTDYPGACSISSEDHGFTAQFVAGFPEVLYVRRFTIDSLTGQVGTWLAGAPFARLRFAQDVSEFEWDSLNGPHLAKLSELWFDHFSEATATRAARSEHLRNLVTLKVPSAPRFAAVVRELVGNPPWTGLRSLTLSGLTPPDAIRMLTDRCTLTELEDLSFGICEVPEFQPFGALTGAIGTVLGEMFSSLATLFGPMHPGPIHWTDYWPALEAFARSPVCVQLRRLRIESAPHGVLTGAFGTSLHYASGGLLPDTLVRALADGLNPDRLVRLELPAAWLSPASRADLVQRFGSRFVPISPLV